MFFFFLHWPLLTWYKCPWVKVHSHTTPQILCFHTLSPFLPACTHGRFKRTLMDYYLVFFFSFKAFPLLVQYSLFFHFRSVAVATSYPELSCTIFKAGILALCWCSLQGVCLYLYVSLRPKEHMVLKPDDIYYHLAEGSTVHISQVL